MATARENKRWLIAAIVTLVSISCGEGKGGPSDDVQRQAASHAPFAASSASDTTQDKGVVNVELKPVGNSVTNGVAVFKNVDDVGVQVELEVAGLPKPEETYYARVREGGCATAVHGQDGDHDEHVSGEASSHNEDDHEGPDHEAHDHGGHAHSPSAEDLPGNLDVPIPMASSSTGSASASAVQRGIRLNQLTSGEPKYLAVYTSSFEDPAALACGALS